MRVIRFVLVSLLVGAVGGSPAVAQDTGGNDRVSAVELAEQSLRAAVGYVPRALTPEPELQGSLTGLVTDAQSGRPLPSAQVFVVGSGLGGLSNAGGRFLILNVPEGDHTLRVELIGYAAQERQVSVSEGQATTADFALAEEALSLNEIIVTGTAGQARRREVGNTISQIKIADVQAPGTSVGSLLQGRVAGAYVSFGSGNAGSGPDIRLRGNVSASLSNQPLIYIDGMRANSEPTGGRSGATDVYSPLNDLNPDDIERIEIVKGPAATTLYGTEAAAGVVQIFTKSGGQGAPVWSAEVAQGFSYFRPFGTDEVPYMWLDQVFRGAGDAQLDDGSPNPDYDPSGGRGHRQRYSVSVQGGSPRIGYFVSGAWDDQLDPVETGGLERKSVRANTTFRPLEDLMIQFNSALTKTDISQVQTGNSVTSIMMSAIRGPQNYMAGRRDQDALRILLEKDYDNKVLRVVNGLTINYTPGSDFTHRLTLGYDYSNEDIYLNGPYQYLLPLGDQFLGDFSDYRADGQIRRNYATSAVFSVDYLGTLGLNLTDDLRSTLSFGVQGIQHEVENAEYLGVGFPGPGTWTLSSAAERLTMNENKLRVITGGFFGQNMFALSDKYFLTVGVRVDGNSAFGENLGFEAYPKVSGSYVISDEQFWPESFGQMKLRAAYGWAGRAPGAFDKIRTWNPVSFGSNGQAFYPQNLGNENLGPERTQEVEVGVDAAFLDGRVSAELTYYQQKTTDALFEVAVPASAGDWGAQLENVGELENKGFEIMTNATLLNMRNLRWDVGLGLTTNRSKVLDLGGAAPFSVGNGAWIIEGEPVPVVNTARVMNWHELADPILSNGRVIHGPNQPTHHWMASTELGLPGGLQLAATAELMKGMYAYNYWESGSMSRNIPHPRCYDAYRKADSSWEPGELGYNPSPPKPAARPADMYAWEYANCFGQRSFEEGTIPMDYGELRDISLTVPVSNLVPSLTSSWASRVDMTLAWHNVWTWRNSYMLTGHPEMQQNSTTPNDSGQYQRSITRAMREQLPPQSHFTVSLRAIF